MTDVPHETSTRLTRLRDLVIEENRYQNLVSSTTIQAFETRHIGDSSQLVPLLGIGDILDIGSGGGFPGLVLGILLPDRAIHLVEPRKRRATFLRNAADALDLPNVTVHAVTVERVVLPPVGGITARAVAPLIDLFAMAAHLADENTRWILPKGRRARDELEVATRAWQGDFMLHPSRTDPEAEIVVATNVRRIAR